MIRFAKELYSKTALLKAAYSFTDRFYVHLSVDNDNYVVSVLSKDGDHKLCEEDFKNEILAQEVRSIITEQTHDIRMLLMARAFSSSVINNNDDVPTNQDVHFDLNDILKDWFEKNENC